MTRWVGPASLTATGRLPIDEVAATVAALSETVADLHELGLVHGNLRSEHVLLATDGRPVLCGFGGATLAAHRSPGSSAPADDVQALGQLLRGLVGDVEPEPIPDRRRWWRRPRWTGFQGRALLTLADQATDGGDRSVVTARALAAAIHDIVPDARFGPMAAEPPSGHLIGPPIRCPPTPCRRRPLPHPPHPPHPASGPHQRRRLPRRRWCGPSTTISPRSPAPPRRAGQRRRPSPAGRRRHRTPATGGRCCWWQWSRRSPPSSSPVLGCAPTRRRAAVPANPARPSHPVPRRSPRSPRHRSANRHHRRVRALIGPAARS